MAVNVSVMVRTSPHRTHAFVGSMIRSCQKWLVFETTQRRGGTCGA